VNLKIGCAALRPGPGVRLWKLLYIAYREMKRLEARIYERMAELSKEIDPRTRYFGFVTAQNFYGLDILLSRWRSPK